MERIIDGTLYRGQTLPDTWTVRVWETSNGHRETSARLAVEWVEVGPGKAPMSHAEWIESATTQEELEQRLADCADDEAERAEKNRKRSASRAKTMCRRKIKTCNFDELLTITYRENQTDLDVFKKHFKEWVRRMRRALGGEFAYVAGFEIQKRGSWHAHVCCHKLPKTIERDGVKVPAWQLGTAIWRGIVGADNGMVFVGGKDRFGRPRRDRMSCAKMAAYVSKYITKHAALFPSEKNRYSASEGMVVGKPYVVTFTGLATPFDVLGVVFDCRPGETIVSHRAEKGKDVYWLVTELDRRVFVPPLTGETV